MMQVLIRFLIVWGTLNLILLPIEWRRWKRAKKLIGHGAAMWIVLCGVSLPLFY